VPKKKTDAIHSIAAIPGLTNDSYLIIDNQETGAKSLEWLRSLLAGTGTPMPYVEMTALAAKSSPGANGVLFTPWLAGERSPIGNKHLRGGFTNLALTTSTSDLIRAVLEGVAANSAWLLGYVEKFAGRELTPLRLLGGGAQSSEWCQIYADSLDRAVEQVPIRWSRNFAVRRSWPRSTWADSTSMTSRTSPSRAHVHAQWGRRRALPRSTTAVSDSLYPRQEMVATRQLTRG